MRSTIFCKFRKSRHISETSCNKRQTINDECQCARPFLSEQFVRKAFFQDLMNNNSLAGTLVALAALLASCTTDEANRYYSAVRYPEGAQTESQSSGPDPIVSLL